MAALAVWEYAEQSAKYIFGSALGDPTADAILRALRERPEGMDRTALRQYFQRHKSAAEIARALNVLQEAGLARSQKDEGTGGRPREVWYPCL
jgi:DNA-binding transcriptional ArsR family regulator